MTDFKPFDFIKAASQTKEDLILNSDDPEQAEKQYTPYVVNRGFSYFEDTILHANEMNMRHWLYKDAQFRYFLGSLRSRSRFSKWHKAEKNETLDMIQEYYSCNRKIAKTYLKVLPAVELGKIKEKFIKGG